MTLQAEAAVTSVIVFSNDATELSFSDGTKLQLSPCGASFVYETVLSRGQHPLAEGTRVQQRTEFTTSKFKDKVNQALECRNRFAEHPYLCQRFLHDGVVLQLYADIKEVKWPTSPEKVCRILANDTVKVTSIDECASLMLSSNKQEFTVEFLCKLSQKGFSKRISERNGKLANHFGDKNSDIVGRPSTDFRGDLAKKICNNRFNQYGCMPDSPYLQTLMPGKVLRRKSKEDSENHSQTSFYQQDSVESCQGKAEDGDPSQDHLNKGLQVKKDEELFALKYSYTWVVQHHTVEQSPECWKHPLHLALNFIPEEKLSSHLLENKAKRSFEGEAGIINRGAKLGDSSNILLKESKILKDHNTQEKETKIGSENFKQQQEKPFDVLTSSLPDPLPLACPSSYLHKWRKDAGGRLECEKLDLGEEDMPVGRRIKAFNNSPGCSAYLPRDGTLIKSTGAGDFFIHIIPKGFLQNVFQADIGLIPQEEKCCWKEQLNSLSMTYPVQTVVLEESNVEGLGRFVAYSNGLIRVVFCDRTTLDMEWDFRNRITGSFNENDCQNVSGQLEASNLSSKIRKSVFSSNVRKGVCQLLLPNGEHKLVHLEDPQEYIRYVEVAVEWASWVASSPEQRVNFYSGQDLSQTSQQDWAVMMELQKITCFEYILGNTISPSGCKAGSEKVTQEIDLTKSHSDDVTVTAEMLSGVYLRSGKDESLQLPDAMPNIVKDALRRTNSAIRNIDSELGKT